MDNQQVSIQDLYPIPDRYDGRSFKDYYVTKEGKVYSTKRKGIKELKQHLHKCRGSKLFLRIKLNNKHYLVHRLVVAGVLGTWPKEVEQVNHKDGDTQNNNITNLEIVTHKENVLHAKENKLYTSGKAWYEANRHRFPEAYERYMSILDETSTTNETTLSLAEGSRVEPK